MAVIFPSSPTIGQQVVGDNNVVYIWDGQKWKSANNIGPSLFGISSGVPPSGASNGDAWYDTHAGRAYVYYVSSGSAQWVDMNPTWNGTLTDGTVSPAKLSSGAPSWTASGNFIVDTNTLYVDAAYNSIGIGRTPSPWGGSNGNIRALQLGSGGCVFNWTGSSGSLSLGANLYDNGSGQQIYVNSGGSSLLTFGTDGSFSFARAAAGSPGGTISFTTSLFIDGSGKTGIGTTSPGTPFEVAGGDVRISQSGSGNVGLNILRTGGTASDWYQYIPSGSDALVWYKGSERMRLDGSGRVGIANTSPGFAFCVGTNSIVGTATPDTISLGGTYSNSAGANLKLRVWHDGATTYGFGVSNSQLDYAVPVNANHVFYVNNTARMKITDAGGLKVSNSGAFTLANYAHEITHTTEFSAAFHVYHTGSSGPYGHYVKFLNANPNNTSQYVFTAVDNTNANIYTIWSNGTITARSDAKFKKNVETARNGYLEDLAQLRVVKYNWINHEDDTPKEIGFIAQEVEEVFPGLVLTLPDKDEANNETGEVSRNIKTSVFTPILVKALQEALKRIQALEDEIKALKN